MKIEINSPMIKSNVSGFSNDVATLRASGSVTVSRVLSRVTQSLMTIDKTAVMLNEIGIRSIGQRGNIGLATSFIRVASAPQKFIVQKEADFTWTTI